MYAAVSKQPITSGKVTWQSPSNIALVKYWGKRDPQIPENTSISFTLNNCHTITTLSFNPVSEKQEEIQFEVIFEGQKKASFKPKIATFFKRIENYCPYLSDYSFTVESENSFPHSSGIASSASGMGALALCIMSIERTLSEVEMTDDYFYKKASFLARLGSGSACRSVKGNVVVWGGHEQINESSDLFGVPFDGELHLNFTNYQDTILLVDKGEKQVSSTVGHNLMHGHPYAQQRFAQANNHIVKMKDILINGDLDAFINLVESEALTLHAMMLTSNPYFMLMKPNTLSIINKIWEFRKLNDSKICFTLDAGANVHVLYPEVEKQQVMSFIETELAPLCQNNQYICDSLGDGARQLN
ncbi:diphosphomevalonate decarboxylase [Urechidicola sp. KH5]